MKSRLQVKTTLLLAVPLCVVLAPTVVRADAVTLKFTFFPDPVRVQEFAPGALKVTVTNQNAFPVKLVCIDDVGCKNGFPPTIIFAGGDMGGDKNDEAFNPTDNAKNCQDVNGDFLHLGASGGSCNYTVNFETRDLHVELSGKDSGTWFVNTGVDFNYIDNDGITHVAKAGGFGKIIVTDPGVPEPGSLVLLCGAIVGIAGLRKFSRI